MKTTLAQCGFMVIESPYLSVSLMKGRRACRTSEGLTEQKPRQRLNFSVGLKPSGLE